MTPEQRKLRAEDDGVLYEEEVVEKIKLTLPDEYYFESDCGETEAF